jgi:hypothetical protein
MAMRTRNLSVSIVALVIVGSIGFLNVSHQPRFQAFHTVDVLQLLAAGICYGVALAGILALLRKSSAQ